MHSSNIIILIWRKRAKISTEIMLRILLYLISMHVDTLTIIIIFLAGASLDFCIENKLQECWTQATISTVRLTLLY